jgi:hypothetical protein
MHHHDICIKLINIAIQIQSFLDYFDWTNKISGSILVEHTHLLLLNQKPKSIRDFFIENTNSFRPRI